MTSYQKRKEDIRKLLEIIDVLTGDDQIKSEEMKQGLRLNRNLINLAYFGSRQQGPPFKTGGIMEQIKEKI